MFQMLLVKDIIKLNVDLLLVSILFDDVSLRCIKIPIF